MKKTLLLITLAAISLVASAQLKVTSDGKVKISSTQTTSYANLLVGNSTWGTGSSTVGISGSPATIGTSNNIGIVGTINANYLPSIGFYYEEINDLHEYNGVSSINVNHGRNYGLAGMIGFNNATPYGGTGIYGATHTYLFSYPTNISGIYAGYFEGPIKVTGNITASNMYIPSDSRLSENVVSLNERGNDTSTLDNLLGMNVIQYNMKSRIPDEMPAGIENDSTGNVREAYEYLKKDEMKMTERRHFGIDAEELKKTYPDLVLEGQDGYLAVNYVELVPVLIKAIQELKQQVDELQGTDTVKKTPAKTSATDVGSSSIKKNTLYQNTPNPAKEQTIIRYRLADNAKDAAICIFDMQGKMLKKLPVSSDNDSVTINGYELGQGMFLYSLVINGQEIETKKMIITK